MKKWFLSLVVALCAGTALASPAQDLYDQASFYLRNDYFGFSNVDIEALDLKYNAQLATACAAEGENCPYAKAVPVIVAFVKEINDEHTNYATAEENAALKQQLAGGQSSPRPSFGVRLSPYVSAKAVRVLEVLPNSPAEKGGLKRADLITAYDGTPFGDTLETSVTGFREVAGKGQEMTLSITRGSENLSLKVTPAIYRNTQLPWLEDLGGGIGLLRSDSFINPETGKAFHALLRDAATHGLTKLVIDLRSNGGGLATECLSAVGAFVGPVERLRQSKTATRVDGYRDGTIYQRTDLTAPVRPIYTLQNPVTFAGPISVLVDENSASCAEYFAQDIKFAKRGPIIGAPTVGVGNTGTLIYDLIDGSGLQVTVQRSVRPDGTPYPSQVTPDVAVTRNQDLFNSTGRDVVLEAGIQALGK